MIESGTILLAKLRRGCTIHKGGYVGFKLHDPTTPIPVWIRPNLVTSLEENGQIVRIDAHSSRAGMTWGLP